MQGIGRQDSDRVIDTKLDNLTQCVDKVANTELNMARPLMGQALRGKDESSNKDLQRKIRRDCPA